MKKSPMQLGVARPVWSGVALGLAVMSVSGQEALRQSLAGQQANFDQRNSLREQPYTFKYKDLRVVATATSSLEWTDNVSYYSSRGEDDIILSPGANLAAFLPITDINSLTFSLGVSYQTYFKHSELNRLTLAPGSQLNWNVIIGQVRLNIHDRFSYTEDPIYVAPISGQGKYGGFQNTIGFLASTSLKDIQLSLGYDHLNSWGQGSAAGGMDRTSDMVVGRAGYQLLPSLVWGVEASGGPTSYGKKTMSSSDTLSFGTYADWTVSQNISITPRGGYYLYSFADDGSAGSGSEQGGFYLGLQMQHQLNEFVSYSVSGGRESTLSYAASLLEQWYANANISWRVIRNVSLSTGVSFESASQPVGQFTNDYDRFGANITLGYSLTQRLTTTLSYRYWTKSSPDNPRMDYDQNSVVLNLAYRF